MRLRLPLIAVYVGAALALSQECHAQSLAQSEIAFHALYTMDSSNNLEFINIISDDARFETFDSDSGKVSNGALSLASGKQILKAVSDCRFYAMHRTFHASPKPNEWGILLVWNCPGDRGQQNMTLDFVGDKLTMMGLGLPVLETTPRGK